MSNTTTDYKKPNPFNFISYDGFDGENGTGIRAEVNVQKNKGTIKKIDVNEKGFAHVEFKVPNDKIRFPIQGWIRTDDPVFELVKAAQESGEEVSFRIENQRKPNVARNIPMSELRADSNTARENIKTLLVGINGVLTSEALTLPEEDPQITTGGRIPATKADMQRSQGAGGGGATTTSALDVSTMLGNLEDAIKQGGLHQNVIDAVTAQLVLAGVPVETIFSILGGVDKRDNTRPPQQAGFSTEAPSWKEYNTDGRQNLGSAVVAASVGIETLLVELFHNLLPENTKADNFHDAVAYYLNITLATCDRIQELSYGEGFRSDRGGSSHTRVRGIVFEILKKELPLPVELEPTETGLRFVFNGPKHAEWVRQLGTLGKQRFALAIAASQAKPGFSAPVPASMRPSNEKEAPQAPTAPVEETKSDSAPTPQKPVEPASTTPTPVAEEAPLTPEEEEELSLSNSTQEIVDTTNFYPLEPITPEMAEGEELATTETLIALTKMFENSGFNIKTDPADKSRVSSLLVATFGDAYSNPRGIPDALLEEFVDHYTAMGPEVLHSAVRYVLEEKVN